MRQSRVISREELYKLVWEAPRTTLAKKFGVSDVALGKICRAAGIPVPPQGYWAKKKAGKATPPPRLPPREPGISEQIEIGAAAYGSYHTVSDTELRSIDPVPPTFPESIESVRERVRPRVGKITAPKSLNRAHHAVARLLADDDARREKLIGQSLVFDWDKPRFDSPLQQRRLRILSGIFAGLARFGCKPSIDRREARDISVQVGSQDVYLALELVEQKGRGKAPQTGPRLRLTVKGRTWLKEGGADVAWEDDDAGKLETQLTTICEEILVAGERQYREEALHRYHWARERKQELEEADRQRQEAEERREHERLEQLARDRLQRLLDDAAAHRQATEVRQYVDTVVGRLGTDPSTIPTRKVEAWAKWARAQADALDPITSGRVFPDEFE